MLLSAIGEVWVWRKADQQVYRDGAAGIVRALQNCQAAAQAQAQRAMDEVTSSQQSNAELTEKVMQLGQQLAEAQAQAAQGNALDMAAIQALAAALGVKAA